MIILASPGIGRRNRGFESALQLLFEELQLRDIECKLLGSRDIYSPNMDSKFLKYISSIFKLNLGYKVEMGIFALGLTIQLIITRPRTLIIMDPAIAKTIHFFIKNYKHKPITILWNGGPIKPPYYYVDLVAQTNILLFQESKSFEPSQFYLPHFIPTNFHPKCSAEIARKLLGINEDKIVILCVSAVNETHKQVLTLFTQLSNINLSDRYLILLVGNLGSESHSVFENLKLLKDRLAWKHITLQSNEMYLAYSAADVSILWSKKEGFGMCILESICYEIPVIVRAESDVNATFQELLITVSESDSSDLKQKIEQSLHISPVELKAKSVTVQNKFSATSVIEALITSIEDYSKKRKIYEN